MVYPSPGQVLIYRGGLSEPELLISDGPACFASRAGPLLANPVLTIGERLTRLADVGLRTLWRGAVDFRT